MNGKIILATHKEIYDYPRNSLYMPVYAGAAITKKHLPYQNDCDNWGGGEISALNPTYNELTALFWGWKNLKDYDFLGLCHYSKFLTTKRKIRSWPFYQCFTFLSKQAVELAITQEEIEVLLQDYDIIVKKNIKIPTKYNIERLNQIEKILKKYFPQYLSSFYVVKRRQRWNSQNIFIFKKKMLDEYLEFIYSFCLYGDNLFGTDVFKAGYVTEFLLSIWLKVHEEYSVKELFTISNLKDKIDRNLTVIRYHLGDLLKLRIFHRPPKYRL